MWRHLLLCFLNSMTAKGVRPLVSKLYIRDRSCTKDPKFFAEKRVHTANTAHTQPPVCFLADQYSGLTHQGGGHLVLDTQGAAEDRSYRR